MVVIGRDHWMSSSPTSLLKQSYLQRIAQACLQRALKHTQGRRCHSLSGQPNPVLSHHHSKVLPHIQVELPVVWFMPVVSHPITWQHEEESVQIQFSSYVLTKLFRYAWMRPE